MALTAKSSNKGPREVPEAKTYFARLVGLTDLGHQPGFEYQGKDIPSEYKVEFTYELVTTSMEDGRPFHVSEEVASNDFEGKGIISKMMARVRSIDQDNDTNNGKDLEKMLGKPCMVTIKHNDRGYPVIRGSSAVSSAPDGIEVAELRNPTYAFNMDDPDMDLWARFPEFKQNKIKEALNFDDTELAKKLAEEGEY